MPNPTQSDLHVNQPLTNVSVAWIPNAGDFICQKVFPKVPVQKQSDLYWKWSKSDWRTTNVVKRAPGTESAGVGWNYTTDTYFAHVYAVHRDIDDQVRANADSNFSLDSDSTKFLTNQMLLKRELDWTSTYFKTGVWDTEYTGVAGAPGAGQFKQWNDAASDPIKDVTEWKIQYRLLTGYAPTFMVIGAEVIKELKSHPDIIDRIKFTQRGVVTEELIANLFDIPKLLVSYASYSDAPRINDAVAQDAYAVANDSYKFIADTKSALLGYAPSSPSLLTPSCGYTFVWSGYHAGNSEGIRMKQFRMDHIASDRLECEMTYDMKVVSPDMGVFLNTVVA
jgi:hypothetical protein